MFTVVAAPSFMAGIAFADAVRDWHDGERRGLVPCRCQYNQD
jgi:hypothetical protein